MRDELHTIIARQQSGNVWFLIFLALFVLAAIGVGMLENPNLGAGLCVVPIIRIAQWSFRQ